MKNFTSVMGWLLLAAVLAVPSFLFYNWWSANKAEEARSAASGQAVPRNFFPGQEGAKQGTEAGAVPSAGAAPRAEKPAAAEAAEELPAGTSSQAAPERSPSAAPEAAPRAGAEEPAAAVKPGGEAPAARTGTAPEVAKSSVTETSYFRPRTKRNPFMTPQDYAMLREQEDMRRAAAMERRRANQAPREVPVESRMTIQGIVGTNVIINGEMYSRGDTVMGAKIIRIGTDYIIGEHKGRRFRKAMQ
ncbi:MAG TPA: hypothetical protein PK523_10430 [Elusimicrobiales bacterium]|nr:hypothetical protein [Elusimicrobiales bacterium]